MMDTCDYDADDEYYDWYDDEFEAYLKEPFIRWYYGKPQLDEYDVSEDYTYGMEYD